MKKCFTSAIVINTVLLACLCYFVIDNHSSVTILPSHSSHYSKIPSPSKSSSTGIDYEAILDKPRSTPAFPDWKPGPLSPIKEQIAEEWIPKLKTGDILFRTSDARAANGLRFSKYVEWATESDFSHASIVLKQGEKTYVLEIDDQGVHLFRFVDWLDTPSDPDFAIYRLKSYNDDLLSCIKKEIDQILIDKPEYDFTFDDPEKMYCVESVAIIYLNCGIKLCEPSSVRDVLNPFTFRIFQNINNNMRKENGQALPEDEPLWFVGNEEHGIMSSKHLQEMYRHDTRI